MATLAIDLGTSNSCGVINLGNRPKIVEFPEGFSVPSVVWYNDDGSIKAIGKAALKDCYKKNNIVRFVKRIIGYDMNTQEVREYMDNCLGEVVRGENNMPAFDIPAFPDRTLTPTVVSSHIISHIAKQAERKCGAQIENLVVSVPAFFLQEQIKQTKLAAEMAHVCNPKNIKIVSEPVAAALEYGVISNEHKKKIMVVDFGGGTADICIMEIDSQDFSVLAKHGDRSLGGDDVTNMLCTMMERMYKQTYGDNLIKYPSQSSLRRTKEEQLKEKAEEVKCQFQDEEELQVSLGNISARSLVTPFNESDSDSDSDSEEEEEVMTLRRDDFNREIQPLMTRLVNLTKETLEIGHLTKEDIDEVILVGGSCRLNAVQIALEEEYGDKVNMSDDPDQCVAFGAWRASSYALSQSNIKFTDIVHDYYGICVCDDYSNRDKFEVLIPRGTKFPCSVPFKKTFPLLLLPSGKCYSAAQIDVLMSHDGTMRTAKTKTPFAISNCNDEAGNTVTISFTIDESGIIYVEVTQRFGPNPVWEKQPMYNLSTSTQ